MLPSADRLNMPLFREAGDDECARLSDGGMEVDAGIGV